MSDDEGFVDPMSFYKNTMDSDTDDVRTYAIENDRGEKMRVELHSVDRKKVLDEINRLPDEMLQTLSDADNEEEAKEKADEQNMLSNVDGDTVDAFENICALSMEDPQGDLTYHNFQDIAPQLGFETLFEIGSQVIEISFSDEGKIKHFHELE